MLIMTCTFVIKYIVREKWLVDKNELIKAKAEILSIMPCFCSFPWIHYIMVKKNNYLFYTCFIFKLVKKSLLKKGLTKKVPSTLTS